MAQTGYTPILIYSSSTAAAAPAAGSLTNSTLGSELAINITDGKLFYKDNANAVQVIGWKTVPTTAGGTGLTSYTAGDLTYYASGTTLTKLAIGANTTVLTSSGSAPQWTAQSALSVGTASNLLSNATTGVMQITGPGAGTTRVMTIPNANFTAARTDAAQTFSGLQTFGNGVSVTSGKVTSVYAGGGDFVAVFQNTTSATPYGLRILDAATPAAGYPLLQVANSAGSADYLRVDSSNGNTIVGIGNLIIGTSGKGIDFSATAGTGTSELLNDYEEGTFTATFLSDGGSITTDATVRYGFYTKVGRQVTILCRVKASAISSPTGDAYVQGLPFTSAGTTGLVGIATGFGFNFKNTLTTQMTGSVGASSSLLTLAKYAAGTTSGITADFNSNSEIYFSAVYFTA